MCVTTVVASAAARSAQRLDSGSSLSVLELMSVSPAGEPTQLTPASIADVSSIEGVDEAVGAGGVGVSLSMSSEDAASVSPEALEALAGGFWVVPRFTWNQPAHLGTLDEATLAPGEMLIPSTILGVDTSTLVGRTIIVEFTRAVGPGQGVAESMTMRVAGRYDAQSPRASGPGSVYVSRRDFSTMFAALLGARGGQVPPDAVFPVAWVKTASIADADRVAAQLSMRGFYVNSGGDQAQLSPTLQLLRQGSLVGAVLLALFGAGVGAGMANTWSQLRRWDVGVLASLGWSSRQVAQTYGTELLVVGAGAGLSSALLGSALTFLLGAFLRGRTIAGLAFEGPAVPPWPWLLGVLMVPPLVLLLGAVPGVTRLTRLQPDDALRRDR